MSSDAAVQETNNQAAVAKHAAVAAGYYEDAHVQLFVSRRQQGVRGTPLINRGYFARVAVFRRAVDQFLAAHGPGRAQIVSLGAGFDTLYFRLRPEQRPRAFVELDFGDVTLNKVSVIRRSAALQEIIGKEAWDACATKEQGRVDAGAYHLAPVDLRDRASVEAALERAGLVRSEPVLVLAECVFVYLAPEHTEALLAWFAGAWSSVGIVSYDPFGAQQTAFARTMMGNLAARGSPLLGSPATPTLEAHRQRFLAAGWTHAHAQTMLEAYAALIDEAERARVEQIERFDEYEEWNLIMSHYGIVYAFRGDGPGDEERWDKCAI